MTIYGASGIATAAHFLGFEESFNLAEYKLRLAVLYSTSWREILEDKEMNVENNNLTFNTTEYDLD